LAHGGSSSETWQHGKLNKYGRSIRESTHLTLLGRSTTSKAQEVMDLTSTASRIAPQRCAAAACSVARRTSALSSEYSTLLYSGIERKSRKITHAALSYTKVNFSSMGVVLAIEEFSLKKIRRQLMSG
jgi:hypothetical protein